MYKILYALAILPVLTLFSCAPVNDHVKVFKYDDSIQCGTSGIDLDLMANELINNGIDVLCSQKGHDGLMRIAVCGAETGSINIYKIYQANLINAENIGFESVNTLTEYNDTVCQ